MNNENDDAGMKVFGDPDAAQQRLPSAHQGKHNSLPANVEIMHQYLVTRLCGHTEYHSIKTSLTRLRKLTKSNCPDCCGEHVLMH